MSAVQRRLLQVLGLSLVVVCAVASDALIRVDRREVDEHRIGVRPSIRGGSLFGVVLLKVVVSPQGDVESAVVVSGHDQFAREAEAMERELHFKPFERDGRPMHISFTDFICVAAEGWNSPRIPFPEIKDWHTLRIKLERRGVFPKPSYSVELSGNGEVVFKGEPFGGIRLAGRHLDVVAQPSLARLMSSLRAPDYFSLKGSYQSPHLTDSPSVRISVEFDGHKKEVIDEGDPLYGMPEVVIKLENLIDEIAGSDKSLRGERRQE